MLERIAEWIARWRGRAATNFPAARSTLNIAGPLPVVPQLLADVPGGQSNLVPVSALMQPLRVEVPPWPNSDPAQGKETLRLFWNDVEIELRNWTAPIPPEDLVFEVPLRFLLEGRPVLRYEVTVFNGQSASSAPLTLTIDLTAPALATPDSRLLFDSQVIANGVTVEYLENNGDQVVATLPDYSSPTVGDCIRYYWARQQDAQDMVEERTLTNADLGKPIQLVFSGDLIRQRGDGERYVHYRITDRAGNVSAASQALELMVKATPTPRLLSWPDLPKASGTSETIVLDLNSLRGALEARIPQNAGVGSQEPVEMQWAEPAAMGAATIKGTPGTLAFTIPYDCLAAHSGKVIPLYYKASDDESARRLVKVLAYRPDAPPPQVLEADSDTLSLAKVGSAARIVQEAWALISTDQRIKVRVLGPAGAEHTVAAAYQVTQAEIDAGILGGEGTLTIPKAFLQSQALGSRLLVQVSVSLDAGASWPIASDFELRLTLVA
ncbi:hypothetical protein [Pseudomonas sp.]|uniref:hypothetical protein n=1 Tax=Pseudomonas sp. TaxID=306 RepID=UPI0028A77AB9|nr:hypothetical protein [Pseudomonas sp.]